jgi:hypothetical protein
MIHRKKVAQHTFADGVTTALSKTLPNIRGICEQIEVVVNNNDGDATAIVTIADDLSGTLFTKSGIAENATTVLKATSDATDFDAFQSVGDLTVTVTPSGDPGESGMTVDVYLYIRT